MKNYSKIILSILFLLISDRIAFSQPNAEWIQRFNSSGDQDDYVTDLAIDKSGNVYLTGYVIINDTNQDYVTIKYNTQGNQQWVRFYDGPDHREDKPATIAVDDSGNVVVAGFSYSIDSFEDFLTIKYNSNGDTLWERRFNGSGNGGDIVRTMRMDMFGDIYVSGYGLTCVNCEDIITLKYDINGSLKWVNTYNGSMNGYDDSYVFFSLENSPLFRLKTPHPIYQ